MAKHLTPIVGLAVVVALALAAVFGSMSLANPAWAQDAPTMLKASPGEGMATLSWETDETALGYLVEVMPDGGSWNSLPEVNQHYLSLSRTLLSCAG